VACRYVVLASLTVLLGRCSGTEADNPVTDAVVTACKSTPEHDPSQLDDFFRDRRAAQTASAPLSAAIGKLGQALTSVEDIPPGLSCVEWELVDDTLAVQVINLRSGCGAEFEGGATQSGDAVTLLLENAVCATAACGNCLYDAATAIELTSVRDVDFSLLVDAACDGRPEGEQWRLPLGQQPRGMICGYAFAPGLGSDNGHPFMSCGYDDDRCDEGLDCIDVGDARKHCLPPCTVDADCPLGGGTRCDAGHCAPTASRYYF
jgi:hypothetical protein